MQRLTSTYWLNPSTVNCWLRSAALVWIVHCCELVEWSTKRQAEFDIHSAKQDSAVVLVVLKTPPDGERVLLKRSHAGVHPVYINSLKYFKCYLTMFTPVYGHV